MDCCRLGIAVIAMTVGAAILPPERFQTSFRHRPGVAPVSRDIMGPYDCHTPFKMGPTRTRTRHGSRADQSSGRIRAGGAAAGGRRWMTAGAATNTAFYGPWGRELRVNHRIRIRDSRHRTEDMFVRAIRTGKHGSITADHAADALAGLPQRVW